MGDTSYDYDYKDTTVQSIYDWFGEEVKFEDLVDMTDEELATYLETLYTEALESGILDEAALADFDDAFKTELDDIYYTCATAYKDLDKLYDSGELSSSDMTKIEMLMDDLQEWIDRADTDEDISVYEIWEEAIGEYESKHIDGTDGSDQTFTDSSTYEEGDNIIYDLTASEETETLDDGTLGSDEEDDMWDDDDDGYGDFVVERDENGRVTQDNNGDGVVNELDDPNYVPPEDPQTISIDLDEGSTLEFDSYDEETGVLEYIVTREDGTTYTLTFIGVYEDSNINFVLTGSTGGIDASEISKWPVFLQKMWFESTATQESGNSFYVAVMGGEREDDGVENYTQYYMEDHEVEDGDGTEVEIKPDSDDFDEERTYYVYCDEDSTTADTINLEFPDDAEVEFTEGEDGQLIITVTNAEGQTITIEIFNFGLYQEIDYDTGDIIEDRSDLINIEGGVIDEDDWAALEEIHHNSVYVIAGEEYWNSYYTDEYTRYIYHDGDSIEEQYGS